MRKTKRSENSHETHQKKYGLQSWTCQQVMKYVYHELNQKSSIACSFVEVLLKKEAQGVVNASRQDLLTQLHTEVQQIRALTEIFRLWHEDNRDDEPVDLDKMEVIYRLVEDYMEQKFRNA